MTKANRRPLDAEPLIMDTADPGIPDKRYFKIGEVCELVGLKPHVLRYWESEFKIINPVKTRTKQRLYRKKDVQAVFMVKDLLYRQHYTIAGAKQKLKTERPDKEGEKGPARQLSFDFDPADYKSALKAVLQELKEMKRELDENGKTDKINL